MAGGFSSLLSVLTFALSVNSLAAPPNPFVMGEGGVNIVGFVNINNYQGRGLNLANPSRVSSGTAAIAFTPDFSSSNNQQWQFVSTGSSGQFTIKNGIAPWQLSFPAAPNGNPGGGQTVVSSSAPAIFNVTFTNPPNVQIIDHVNGLALTAWPQTSGVDSSPITFEDVIPALAPQQVWTVVAALASSLNTKLIFSQIHIVDSYGSDLGETCLGEDTAEPAWHFRRSTPVIILPSPLYLPPLVTTNDLSTSPASNAPHFAFKTASRFDDRRENRSRGASPLARIWVIKYYTGAQIHTKINRRDFAWDLSQNSTGTLDGWGHLI
ncbi:hypothetical protein GALMADRAFT_148654 [Galerina marginata CBS 339.88]|uniref:Ricin B lectin domain-containing protein n=1 Tax=Galerina marginata (strain CBS 339.88) TaxID=685588 RepID=A0A067S3W2_GALM3|nr:hypothetical protein GALMADRAFT_148654 [Galerina marginata CBS 339.88]